MSCNQLVYLGVNKGLKEYSAFVENKSKEIASPQ